MEKQAVTDASTSIAIVITITNTSISFVNFNILVFHYSCILACFMYVLVYQIVVMKQAFVFTEYQTAIA